MPVSKISIAPLARLDLDEIWFYTFKNWSENQANKYQDELHFGFQDIFHDPDIGQPVNQIKKGYRRLKINSHYIFYKMLRKEIVIVRILHEKMDILRHL